MLQPGLAGRLTVTIAAEHTAQAMGNPGVHAVASPGQCAVSNTSGERDT